MLEWDQNFSKEPRALAKAISEANRYLSYRSRSEAEVRAHLAKKHQPEIVNIVVTTMSENGLLDDAKFAKEWHESRVKFRPRSAWLIARELRAKGVHADIVEATVDSSMDEENAYNIGKHLSSKLASLDDKRLRRRLWMHLHRRGFRSELIQAVVNWLSAKQSCERPMDK
jgi:regulatory protein